MDALANSPDVFEEFFVSARIGLALADLNGSYVRVNRTYAELLGRAPEDLVGVPLADVLEDALALRLANGATASVSGAATVPKHCGYQLDLRVFGTEGMLLLDIERQRMEVRRKDRRDTVLDLPPGAGAYAAEPAVARLVDLCLGTAARNEAPGLVGQRAVEVLDAMHRSLASGRAERV